MLDRILAEQQDMRVRQKLVRTSCRLPRRFTLTQAALTTASKGESRTSDRSAGSASASTRGSGPDYSWLKRLLWERIDRIKQYSDDAVENEWEGRVVIGGDHPVGWTN